MIETHLERYSFLFFSLTVQVRVLRENQSLVIDFLAPYGLQTVQNLQA
nr:MAG TPA: hypothetical protein [Caudoviricetes sp.]